LVVDHGFFLLLEEIDAFRRDFNFKTWSAYLAAGDLESCRGDFHFHEPRARIWRSVGEFLADAGGGLDILGEEKNIPAPTGARELRGGCPIRNAREDLADIRRIRAGVEGAIEFPAPANDAAEVVPGLAVEKVK
jgi:hypothetical protein